LLIVEKDIIIVYVLSTVFKGINENFSNECKDYYNKSEV